jgi:hypothetical protein
VKFRFLQRPEYLEENSIFKFREGETKGTGRVISLLSIEDDSNGKTPTSKTKRKNRRATLIQS